MREKRQPVRDRAQLTVAPLGAGTVQSVVAEYLGSSTHLASTSAPAVFTVVQAASTVTLTPVTTPNRAGFQLVSTMDRAPNGAMPTGAVTYFVNGRPFRTVNLADGQATVFVRRGMAMGRSFCASYSGDANFEPSQSEPVVIGRSTISATPSGPRALEPVS